MLGLLLFSIYMNPLTTISVSQDSSSLIFYANDIVLYWPIRTLSDVEPLQSDVEKISNGPGPKHKQH